MGPVADAQAVTAIVRRTLDAPTARALQHPWFEPTRFIWRPHDRRLTRKAIRDRVRRPAQQRGEQTLRARATRLSQGDPILGAALAARSWTDINRLLATTSDQRLLLRRLKSDRIPGWDRLHERHGCPHCPEDTTGGTIAHIFWSCPQAQALWQVLFDGWRPFELWPDMLTGDFERAVFGLALPLVPSTIWNLPALQTVDPSDAETVDHVHQTVQVAWQQQVLCVLSTLRRWRTYVADGALQWSPLQARLVLAASLHATTTGLLWRLPRCPTLRDARVQVLDALTSGFTADVTTFPSTPKPTGDRYIMFFDGGSRGNPGPGGAGAVIVRTDRELTTATVVWSACMSYAQPTMTNNRAEYLGAIAGLQAAHTHGWKVSVVGDSALILNQLRRYRPPKHPALRPLYSTARRLADQVGVCDWCHHLRAFNKMADAAANIGMDSRRSTQARHSPTQPHQARIEAHLDEDFQEWRRRHLLLPPGGMDYPS